MGAVTGFRRYMSPLVGHLEWEITGRTDREFTGPFVNGMPALTALGGRGSVLDTWLEYVDGNNANFQQNVNASKEECAESVIFMGLRAMRGGASAAHKPPTASSG